MELNEIIIQIYSDIHIEIWNKLPEIPIKSKYLFLAGDICPLNHPLFYKFFDFCSSSWEKVFYIPGNHEFYSEKKNYNELDFEYNLKLKERYKNVYYLNDTFVELNDDINVYGSIFWTSPTYSSTYTAKMDIKDYNYIKYFNTQLNHVVKLDINFIKELSDKSFVLLKNHLENTKKITIVMTHFPPLSENTRNPIYINQKENLKNYFSWNDETINALNLEHVPLWITGHTHWSYAIHKKNCFFISNQIGYKHEANVIGFNEIGLYRIKY
jgi:predicted phosphohydrolase